MIGSKSSKNRKKKSHDRLLMDIEFDTKQRKKELNRKIRRKLNIKNGCQYKHVHGVIFDTMV